MCTRALRYIGEPQRELASLVSLRLVDVTVEAPHVRALRLSESGPPDRCPRHLGRP